jgi:hypothetical protein
MEGARLNSYCTKGDDAFLISMPSTLALPARREMYPATARCHAVASSAFAICAATSS